MILTVDIGNSRIKWVLWQSEEIVFRAGVDYEKGRCNKALDRLLRDVSHLIQGESSGKPSHVYTICVAGGEVRNALTKWVRQHWQLDVEYLETQKRYDKIVNAYSDPGQYGVDRWASIVAASQVCPDVPICVIGAGTAITFDLVKEDGRHLGGYILPSLSTMHNALSLSTENVMSELDIKYREQGVPDNTNDAVNQGLHRLLQAGIREFCEHAQEQLGESVKIILTGGFAPVILGYPDMPPMNHEPDLVMKGLYGMMQQKKGVTGN